jgi:uncharacterized membrane protein
MMSDDLRRELNHEPRTSVYRNRLKPSVATVMGHALHPILVAFPVVLYSVATACFIAYAVNLQPFWFKAAFYANVAGVVAAVIAAIPGMMDYFGAIPNRDPAKKVARTHVAFNSLALILFAVNAAILWNVVTPEVLRVEAFDSFDYRASMGISIVGLLSTLAAGYFGGTLVQEHGMGLQRRTSSLKGNRVSQLQV